MRVKTLLFAAAGLSALTTAAWAADAPADDANKVSEVVITAAPFAVSLDSATTSVNVVSRADLDTAPAVGLGDLLGGLPGLRSSFFGPGASRPIIRGMSGPRVLILQNGVGLVDASTLSPDHAVASEPSEASRIEVLRGPSALAYGGSAIGGVVNIFDDRIPTAPAKNGLEGRVGGSYDGNNDGRALSAGFKAGKGPWVVAVDGVKRKSDDYEVPSNPVSARYAAAHGVVAAPDDKVQNTDVEMEAYGIGVSYVADDGYIGASVKKTDTTYGVPFPQTVLGPLDEAPEKVQIHLQQTRYDLRGEKTVDWGPFDKARFSIGYADYQHAEVSVADGAVGTRFLSNGTEGRFELVQKEHDGFQGAVGLQALKRHFEAIGDEAFVPPVDIQGVGVFTLQRLDKQSWGVEGGVRLDRTEIDAELTGRPTSPVAADLGVDWATAAHKRDFTTVSASASVFVRPQSWSFYALSLSHNERAPSEFELFADGPHGGTNAYEIGDPSLKAEKVNSAELTARLTGGKGRVEAHAYYAKYNGYIEEAPIDAVQNDLPVIFFSQTDATFYGGELSGTYDVWSPNADSALSVQGAYDYVHGEVDTGPAARMPPYSVTGALVWSSPRFTAKGEVRYVAKQDRVSTFEIPTDGYTMLNVSASYKPFADKGLKLFVDGHNLTDEQAREHTSFLKDIAPLPGRSLRAGFAYEF
ncbi:MAG: TonB-dependent receptor [Caulobacter sp.]|nr:TonB-dependent receptor [Caulobacter sp.]